MIRLLLTLVLALVCTTARAAGSEPDRSLSCNPGGNQLQLNACAADALADADAQLNAVYRQILSALPDGSAARRTLRDAQRLWIVQRDADLQAAFPLEAGEQARVMYGSMYPMLHAQAKAELTRARTRWLRDTFTGNDG